MSLVNDRLAHRTHSEIDTTLSCQSTDSGRQMTVGQLAVAFHTQCASRTGKVSAVHFHFLLVANYPNWMTVRQGCQVLQTWRKNLQTAGLWQAVPCHARSFARSPLTRTGVGPSIGHILKFKSTQPLPSNQSLVGQQTDHICLGRPYASKSRKLAAAHQHLLCSKGLRQVLARLDLTESQNLNLAMRRHARCLLECCKPRAFLWQASQCLTTFELFVIIHLEDRLGHWKHSEIDATLTGTDSRI